MRIILTSGFFWATQAQQPPLLAGLLDPKRFPLYAQRQRAAAKKATDGRLERGRSVSPSFRLKQKFVWEMPRSDWLISEDSV